MHLRLTSRPAMMSETGGAGRRKLSALSRIFANKGAAGHTRAHPITAAPKTCQKCLEGADQQQKYLDPLHVRWKDGHFGS